MPTEREPEAYRRARNARKLDAAQRARRDEEIWRLYIAGRNERSIALEYDITVRNVSRIIAEHRKLVAEDAPSVEDFRTMIVEGTRDVIATMVDLMHKDPAPAYSNGRPVLDADGNQTMDYSMRMAAADRVLKAYERLGKVTGVEAPDVHQVTVQVQAQSDAEIAAQAALARLMAAANMPALPSVATTTPAYVPESITVDNVATEDVHVDQH